MRPHADSSAERLRRHSCAVLYGAFNQSLRTGSVPTVFKETYITPLIKKADSDVDDMRSYRPISNLPVLSKLLRASRFPATFGLSLHYSGRADRRLHSSTSAYYRRFHSTETAVLKVLAEILRALDNGDVAVLTLLDLSAAFDTVDHVYLPEITSF